MLLQLLLVAVFIQGNILLPHSLFSLFRSLSSITSRTLPGCHGRQKSMLWRSSSVTTRPRHSPANQVKCLFFSSQAKIKITIFFFFFSHFGARTALISSVISYKYAGRCKVRTGGVVFLKSLTRSGRRVRSERLKEKDK